MPDIIIIFSSRAHILAHINALSILADNLLQRTRTITRDHPNRRRRESKTGELIR